jgi:Caspase domain
MKKKIFKGLICCLIFAVAIQQKTFAQAAYHLNFRLPGTEDTTVYQSFMLVNPSGSGFIRISDGKRRMQATLQEQYALLPGGEPDTSILLYKTTEATAISGWTKLPESFTLWFKQNTASGFFEPAGITLSTENTFQEKDAFTAARFLETKMISKELLLQFFTEKDDFYENMFGNRSKGGSLSPEERKTKLFLVIVASSNDSTIGPACLKDAKLAEKSFAQVADVLKIRLVTDTVLGSTYSKSSVEQVLSRINPVANRDIVVFYYSGHGFKNDAIPGKEFPFLDLRDPRLGKRPDPRQNTLNIEDIFNTLKKKEARLTLVISDCCNDEIVQKRREVTPPPKGKNTGLKWSFDNVKTLFMNPEPTAWLVTAASKDERAGSINSFGSIYTNYFFASLSGALSPQNSLPFWEQVLAEAQLQTIVRVSNAVCRKPPCKQTPKMLFPKK